mmetsp:Transcript_28341/g.81652  ORF Transcript_28341/g.81652 Transcript_28341/m.81652 type:complete len:235 (+) Transcript_28341:382-1086(+)
MHRFHRFCPKVIQGPNESPFSSGRPVSPSSSAYHSAYSRQKFSPLRYADSIAYQRLAQSCSCKGSAVAVERSLKLLLFFLVVIDWTSDLAVGVDLVTRGLLWQSVIIFVLSLCDCVALNAHWRARPLMELSVRFHLTVFIVSLGEIPIAIITFMSMPVDQSDLSTLVLYVLSIVFTCLMVCFKGGMLFAQVRRERLREKRTTSSITRTTTSTTTRTTTREYCLRPVSHQVTQDR